MGGPTQLDACCWGLATWWALPSLMLGAPIGFKIKPVKLRSQTRLVTSFFNFSFCYKLGLSAAAHVRASPDLIVIAVILTA